MILIISIEFDKSTYEVFNWLKAKFNQEVIVLSESNFVKELKLSIDILNNYCIELITTNKDIINLSFIKSTWLRKGHIYYEEQICHPKIEQIRQIIRKDIVDINDVITHLLSTKKLIGDINNTEINKFKVLVAANEVGLLIPNTLITNRKIYLAEYYSKNKVIAKSINSIHFETKKLVFQGFTKNIDISGIPENFNLSFTQEMILKKYELRIFFIYDKFYASAIFSQSNEKTQLDFRNYDNQKPNRIVPYILPEAIRIKLSRLMNNLGLNTGSIDMIVNTNYEYIFLEVNPAGQFGMISRPCNFFLEREVAKSLLCNAE